MPVADTTVTLAAIALETHRIRFGPMVIPLPRHSPWTVARQALTLLENQGYVYRRPPRGTFVAEPRVLFRVGSFSAEVTRAGRRPGARR